MQIGELERDAQKDILFKDICNIIAAKCVHPTSKRTFSVDSIKTALREIHYPIKLEATAKKQAMDAIKCLEEHYEIARAEMLLKITVDSSKKESLLKGLAEIGVFNVKSIKGIGTSTESVEVVVHPSRFRDIDALSKRTTIEASVEVLIQAIATKEVKDLESAGELNLQRKTKDGGETQGKGKKGKKAPKNM